MAIKILSTIASFVQFGDVAEQPFQKQANIPLIEEDKWNVAFQFSIFDDEDGYLPTSNVYKVGICGFDGTLKVALGNCKPLYNRTHILFADDSINLVTIIVGSTGKTFNRLVSRKELIEELIGMGIVAYDAGSYIWYKEASPADITINYLDVDNVSQQLQFEKYLDVLYADVDINMTGDVAIGECYRYGILTSADAVLGVSNAFKRVDDEKYKALVRYRSVEDSMEFIYSTSEAVYNRLTIPMYLSDPQYPSQRKVYTKSNGANVVLSAILDKEWPMISEWMPDWLHQALVVAIHHDTFEIYIAGAWKGMTLNADYKIEWSEDTYDSGQASSKFKEQIYNFKNDNAGNELTSCLPPYVKLVSVTTELATFELYPNINCQNFDFRFRQKDTVDWSVNIPIEIAGYAAHTYTLDLTPYPFTAFEYQFRSRCANGETSEWGYVHSFGTDACDPVFIISGATLLPVGEVGTPFSHVITLGGDAPFALTSISKPSWMTVTLLGSVITLAGTPDAAGTGIGVDFNITNCTGANILPFAVTIDVNDIPAPSTGTIYLELTSCGGGSITLKDSFGTDYPLIAGDCSNSIDVPYGTYVIHSMLYDSCTGGGGTPEILPALGTYFIIDASNISQTITINCLT